MTFYGLIALASAVWLLSCAASALALYWNVAAPVQRLRAAFISSCLALLIGYLALGRIQLNASKTVNGHVQWSINSRWFFIGALVLGGASLVLTLRNWRRASSRLVPASQAGEAGGRFGVEPGAAPNAGPTAPPSNSEASGGISSVS